MFKNIPFTDFTVTANRTALSEKLAEIDSQINRHEISACPIIDGRDRKVSEILQSLDPSSPDVVVGNVHLAGTSEVDDSIKSLLKGRAAWEKTPWETRASILDKLAERMTEQRHSLSALIIREAGKPWKEADGDVAEAIDFCTYYAEEARKMGPSKKTMEVPGEDNHYFYQSRGLAVVIAPWNFPLAIACGMTVAALVTGNVTILKPAEQTSLIAYRFAKLLLECGVPGYAFAFLPGYGEVIGRHLTASPDVDLICFTGSKPVGLEIIRKSAEILPGQRNIRKVIAELGGKNAIIVDTDADLDDAIKGVLYSAFGFAGQKCSACSRVIVVGSAYETFVKRFAEASADILVGKASDPATLLGPVIDEDACKRILATIEGASRELKVAFKGEIPKNGYFVPATIFADVPPSSAIWREEIFGPVVACTQAKTFEDAIKLANDSQYALTGGIFSRSPSHIELAKHEFKVGNLYINRGCTGALVCRQPFGGFKMSGIGSKAGGPDYLQQFVEPRTITENTMRRGFVPSV